jgi:hypothetical protein
MAAMNRVAAGRYAGVAGTLVVLSLWIGLALPERLTPRLGLSVGLSLMTAGVLLTGVAAILHSKLWLLTLAAAIVTFVLFFIASTA